MTTSQPDSASTGLAPNLVRKAQWHRPYLPTPDRGRVTTLLFWQIGALAAQVLAVILARLGHRSIAELFSDIGLAAIYASALWALTAARLDRVTRNVAVLCLGVGPTLFWRATNPLLFTGFDEQLHMRTLGDILSSHRLFEANPLLDVSPRYPGIEAVATLIHQLGIPTMAAAFVVVLVCRVVLVTVLCDTVEHLTGSERAGGLAVAVYALSSQFVFFNSQFAYQTMALPLALAAVSFIARAQEFDDPMPFVGGASLCLFAVAVTHHVTSFLTAALLLLWALADRGMGRLWLVYGACAAVATTLSWAIVQRQLLSDYLGPIINDVRAQFTTGQRRELFKDSAGFAARSLDQYFLLYYAGALTMIVAVILVLAYREHHRGGRLVLIAMMTASIPLALAARVVPKGGELYDRFNSFLFIPFALYAASFITWFWWREPHHYGFSEHRKIRTIRLLAVALAASAFVGGYVLGSGPNWARLPGPYMVSADTRSMDPETLAAAKWARDALPAGSRISADRVSSTLLASQAGLWPVMKGPNETDVAALYVARTWGTAETDLAGAMRLRYLYVDRRLADELPHFGSYFFEGETGDGQQLTDQQLSKFERVPGISLVYRHGPVSIYDLSGLGIAELRSGWFGMTPQVRLPTQLAVGLSCGLFLCLVMRSRFWPRLRGCGDRLRSAWGPAMTGAALLSAASLLSIALLVVGVWLTPLTFWSGAAVVLMVNLAAAVSVVRRISAAVPRRAVRTAVLIAVPFLVVVTGAVADAAQGDIVEVHRILEDPRAVHVPPKGTGG